MTMIVAAVTRMRESRLPSIMPNSMTGSINGPKSMASPEQLPWEYSTPDDTKITCSHKRWAKDGGGAFDVQLADGNDDAAVVWQVEEWIHDANAQTKQKVDPNGVIMHRTSVAHANPTPVKLKKAIVRTDGAGLKITDWCRKDRAGLPWFSTASAAAMAPEEPGSTAVVPGGRHGTFGAFVAHTELTKKETTKTMEAQGGQITKLDEAMAKSQEMLQTLMGALGANSQQTKALSGRVDGIDQKTDQIGAKTDRIIAALEKAGVAVSPDAAAPTSAPAATSAPSGGAPKPPAQNPWMTASSGGGRGGGGSKRKPGRGMGGPVREDYEGMDDDDDDEHTVPPSIAARTRGSIARRVEAVRLLISGAGSPDGLGAVGDDSREPAADTEHDWAEHIKQQYDIGDGSDARVAAVLDVIQRTEGELANAEIGDMHF